MTTTTAWISRPVGLTIAALLAVAGCSTDTATDTETTTTSASETTSEGSLLPPAEGNTEYPSP